MPSSGNFAKWSPLFKNTTSNYANLSEGDLRLDGTTNNSTVLTDFAIPVGTKFYAEVLAKLGANYYGIFGIAPPTLTLTSYARTLANVYGIEQRTEPSGFTINSISNTTVGSNSSSLGTPSTAVYGLAVNRVDNELKIYLDNVLKFTLSIPSTGEYHFMACHTGGVGITSVHYNFNGGQDSTGAGDFSAASNSDENGFGEFQHSPPSGHLACCSANLPTSSDIDPAETDANFPEKNFAPILYTGNSSTNAITGLGFKPDLVFIQRRNTSGGFGTPMVDSNRGVTVGTFMNRTDADGNFTNDFSSFDTDGFTLKAGSTANINNNTQTFVAWCWRANEGTTTSDSSGDITVTRQVNDAAKFSICTWTGNGSSGSTLPHGLGVAPAMTWIKKRSATSSMNIWHSGFNNADPDSFGEPVSSSAWYANQGANGTYTTAPDATNLTLTAYGQVNGSSATYVGYFWANVEGMQKFGGYTGNGDADGPFIYLGFRPRMLFLKRTDGSGSWQCHDSVRDTYNPVNKILLWNTADAEFTSGDRVRFLSNGFKILNSNNAINADGGNFVYGAWADVPAKYSTAF